MGRYELTDSEWKAIEPCLPNKPRGVPRVDDRRVLNGIFWVLRSGARWADLPERYGPPTTIHNGFNRWRKAGVWDRLMDAITKAHDGNVRMCRPVAVPASTRKTGGSKCSIPSLPAARCLPALAATGVHWPARVEPQWNKYAESRLAVIRTPSRPLRLCEPCKGLRKGVDSTCPIGNAITSERNPSSH